MGKYNAVWTCHRINAITRYYNYYYLLFLNGQISINASTIDLISYSHISTCVVHTSHSTIVMFCLNLSNFTLLCSQHPRRVLSYLAMVERFSGDDGFWDLRSEWVPMLYLIIFGLTPSFCRKNQFVSITFSSRDTWT